MCNVGFDIWPVRQSAGVGLSIRQGFSGALGKISV
jgi:hypothetical protein